MNKPSRPLAKPLRELLNKLVGDAFARQGFASAELVTRWDDIVGHEIAAHSEPIKLQWPRRTDSKDSEAGTLVLRVEGPAAIEIQHLADVICERVNRFLGWRAIDRVALCQAPLARRDRPRPPPVFDSAEARCIADAMTGIADDKLRAALGRLGAAVRRK